MPLFHTPARSVRWPRYLAAALIVSLQAQSLMPAWAQSAAPTAPSQNPLISQGNAVPPNMMVTLDTSWSMIFPYMPEGDVNLAGGIVKFPGFTSVIMHPNDTRHAIDQGPTKGDGGAIPGDNTAAAGVFQMQMRSPDVNSLYYDPAVTYKPWILQSKDAVTGEYKRYPAADPTKALFDPDKPTGAFANLTQVDTAKTATWCVNGPANSGDKLSCASSAKSFNPGLYYRLDGASTTCKKIGGAPDPNDVRCYTKFDINSSATFKKYSTRTDCAGSTCTVTDERLNFANWFVYYRTRLHIAQASLPETFLQLKDNKLRTGWATIHSGAIDVDGVSTRNVISGVRKMEASRKQALVEWIRAFKSDDKVTNSTADPKLRGGTPLLSAITGVGDYFLRTDSRSPWADDPDGGTVKVENSLSCRRSYNLLITDGYYTDAGSNPKSTVNGSTTTIGNEDGTASTATITAPANAKSYKYTPRAPYMDGCPGTMADVAMYYWKNDLIKDMPNNVPAGKDNLTQNPAFWQHLVQFNIGLGVSGNIPYNDLANQLDKLTTGEKGWWPSATDPKANNSCSVSGNDPKLVDDLLHAAINSRGQYFSVKTPVQLTNALTTALSRAGRQEGMTQAGVALQTQYVNAINVKYVPEYTSEQWIGDVKAYESTSVNNWAPKSSPTWSALEKLPAHADRNIVTWTGTAGGKFQSGSVGATNDATLTANLPEGATEAQLINYIRGDTSQEDAAQKLNLFRQRDALLGDFINSPPTLLKGNVDLQYDKLPTTAPGQSSYAAFRDRKAARPPLLFVGGNGGMLHAFADYDGTNGDSANPSKARGQEVFAFVPQAAMAGLGNLARRDYGTAGNPHRFFVDGPLTESDAYDGSAWRNVLIGTTGAGGRSIFALDVTPGKTLDANAVMWERSSTDDPDFGYMLGDAQVGMLPDGTWKVFVGNGPYSTNGHAVLMMIDLFSGKTTKLDVSASDEKNNGLGAVQLVKNSNQQVVAIYAGDLLGRMWRFDVNGSGAVSKGLEGQPLFVAPTGQPITAAPGIVSHPLGGYMVLFGTGKLFDDTDPDSVTTQSLYGVWDAPLSVSAGLPTSNINRDMLVEQKIVLNAVAKNANGQSYYDINYTTVDYKAKRGWFIDLLLGAGQRLVYPSTVVDDFVLMNTVVPAKASDTPSCSSANGKGYSFFLPALMDGRYTKTQTVDTNGDGVVNAADAIASVYSTGADGRRKTELPTPAGGGTDTPNTPCGQKSLELFDVGVNESQSLAKRSGACSKINSRIWRQILTPPQP